MAKRRYYQKELYHDGLNKRQIIRASSIYELEQKERVLLSQWEVQWSKVLEKEQKKHNLEASLAYAAKQTEQCENLQVQLDTILKRNMHPKRKSVLSTLSKFSEPKPKCSFLKDNPNKPARTDNKYNPPIPFLTKLSKKKTLEFESAHTREFECDLSLWEEQTQNLADWNTRKSAHQALIADLFEQFQKGDAASIERYLSLAIESIKLPLDFNISAITEYSKSEKRLVVDLTLPEFKEIPKLKSIAYIKSRQEFKETDYPEQALKKKYDSVIYQIVLLTLDYIFSLSADLSIIESAAINGRVCTVDPATGKTIEPCILSVLVSRNDFDELVLEDIDPKSWFKRMKGISAQTLALTTAIAPIISISKEDSRFIDGYAVADNLNDSVNLAAMDWQDFENLIREIFEKEFSTTGGEVEITQASRDGGVDAVAFDPDPIRGGKIVIQAKRYTNVVGVSAVRDLYGTVMNEGAIKGILVTTSDFGPDSYKFASGKPLTLINGANLLYLLEKYGYSAKIDIAEAKSLLKK